MFCFVNLPCFYSTNGKSFTIWLKLIIVSLFLTPVFVSKSAEQWTRRPSLPDLCKQQLISFPTSIFDVYGCRTEQWNDVNIIVSFSLSCFSFPTLPTRKVEGAADTREFKRSPANSEKGSVRTFPLFYALLHSENIGSPPQT